MNQQEQSDNERDTEMFEYTFFLKFVSFWNNFIKHVALNSKCFKTVDVIEKNQKLKWFRAPEKYFPSTVN